MSAIDRLRRAVQAAATAPWRPVLLNDPCVYCTVWPLETEWRQCDDSKTIEHILPKSADGKNSWRNLAVAHRSCNEHRSSTPLLVYFLYRQQSAGLVGRHHKAARRRLRQALMVRAER